MSLSGYLVILQVSVIVPGQDLERSDVRSRAISEVLTHPDRYSEGFDLVASEVHTLEG